MQFADLNKNEIEARRSFLKKVAYAAPAVVALGTLTAPQSAHASILNLTADGILPNAKWSANYDTSMDKYANVVRSGNIGTTTFKDQVVNTSPFRAWLKSLFGF